MKTEKRVDTDFGHLPKFVVTGYIHLDLKKNDTKFELEIQSTGGVIVDWGDNSKTGAGVNGVTTKLSNNYRKSGKYTITLYSTSGILNLEYDKSLVSHELVNYVGGYLKFLPEGLSLPTDINLKDFVKFVMGQMVK